MLIECAILASLAAGGAVIAHQHRVTTRLARRVEALERACASDQIGLGSAVEDEFKALQEPEISEEDAKAMRIPPPLPKYFRVRPGEYVAAPPNCWYWWIGTQARGWSKVSAGGILSAWHTHTISKRRPKEPPPPLEDAPFWDEGEKPEPPKPEKKRDAPRFERTLCCQLRQVGLDVDWCEGKVIARMPDTKRYEAIWVNGHPTHFWNKAVPSSVNPIEPAKIRI